MVKRERRTSMVIGGVAFRSVYVEVDGEDK
jgi:hypothetical protein